MASNLGFAEQQNPSKQRLLLSPTYYSISNGGFDHSYTIHQHQDQEQGCCLRLHRRFRITGNKISRLWRLLKETAMKAYDMGRSDPRNVMFATKMGAALSLVSLLIFFHEPPNIFTDKSIWAILTVVVVFEFSMGNSSFLLILRNFTPLVSALSFYSRFCV